MNRIFLRCIATLLVCAYCTMGLAQNAKPSLADQINIENTKFVLPNGLTVIVHEDHKAPIVAVNVWYHVGSKNEVPGKSGFAHLFEHLMFNGSENYNKDYFKALEAFGATDLNGTTNKDRTNYFQNVPTSALDQLLFLESDRMGHLLGAIDQAKLDEQRGVVQNEKRQGENQPYSLVDDEAIKILYPSNHPYAYPQGTVIGSMEDLNAASLKDVQEWFKAYYGPNNATVVIAGDITVAQAKEKVTKYFGGFPANPPITRVSAWIPKLESKVRKVMEDRVAQARLYKFWNTPEATSMANDQLDMLATLLGQGKTSRLFKRLVYVDQIATNVVAYVDDGEIAGNFVINATAKPGVPLSKLEAAIDDEIAKLLREGPTEDEVERTRTQIFASLIRGLERIGGFGGKSDLLASSQVYKGSPDAYKETLRTLENTKSADLKKVGNQWLGDNHLVVEVYPYNSKFSTTADVDRKSIPGLGTSPVVAFPALQRATLKNGLKVVLAERKTVPVVNFSLRLDAGYSSDNAGNAGISSLAMNMMDEGTSKRNALQISEELANLGANLNTNSTLDVSVVSLSALRLNLDKSLELMADVVLNPTFPAQDFDRLKKQQLTQIDQEKLQAQGMVARTLPKFIYGENSGYGLPGTGSGFKETVEKLTREDMVKWHQQWVKPGSATLIVVGDISLAELTAKLETAFAGWTKGEAPKKNIPQATLAPKTTIYIIDKPGAIQSQIAAAELTLPNNNPEEVAVEMFNKVLGADFVSRINMNLREDKHWSYGAGGNTSAGRLMRHYGVNTGVQTDKTKESILEIQKELSDIVGNRPPTEEEFARAQNDLAMQLPGRWETMNAVLGSVAYVVNNNLADDYFQKYSSKVLGLKLADVKAVAAKVIKPANITYVIAGDRAKIEAGIRELNMGEVKIIDADGKLVK